MHILSIYFIAIFVKKKKIFRSQIYINYPTLQSISSVFFYLYAVSPWLLFILPALNAVFTAIWGGFYNYNGKDEQTQLLCFLFFLNPSLEKLQHNCANLHYVKLRLHGNSIFLYVDANSNTHIKVVKYICANHRWLLPFFYFQFSLLFAFLFRL